MYRSLNMPFSRTYVTITQLITVTVRLFMWANKMTTYKLFKLNNSLFFCCKYNHSDGKGNSRR